MSITKDNETDYTMTLLNFDTEGGPFLSGIISTEVQSLDPLTVKITAILNVTEGEFSIYGVEGTAIWASGTTLIELPASVIGSITCDGKSYDLATVYDKIEK